MNGFLDFGLGRVSMLSADSHTLHAHAELIHLECEAQPLTWRFFRHDTSLPP